MSRILIEAYSRMVEGLENALPGWRALDRDERRERVESLRKLLADRWAALEASADEPRRLAQLTEEFRPTDQKLLALGSLLRELLRIEVGSFLEAPPAKPGTPAVATNASIVVAEHAELAGVQGMTIVAFLRSGQHEPSSKTATLLGVLREGGVEMTKAGLEERLPLPVLLAATTQSFRVKENELP
jgi:hypothetical protein